LKLGKDCTGLEAKPQTAQERLVELKIHCHNCGIIFEKDDEIYVHTKEKEYPSPVCHKKCREDLPKPESKRVGQEIKQEIKQETNVFRSHLSKDAKAGYSVFGHHVDGVRKKWTADELSDLEEMWKEKHNGQWLYNMGEIADRLDRTEGAIEYRIRKEKIYEKTGRCLPPTIPQLNYLKALGYPEIPTCRKEASEKIEELLYKPTSTTFEAELRATGYDGSTPKTNKETLDAIKERQDPTEKQIKFLKQICAKMGKEFEMPSNKLEASNKIDQLLEESKSKQINIPNLSGNRPKRTKTKKDLTGNEEKCPECEGLSALRDSTIDCKSCRNEGTFEVYEHVKSLKFKCPKCEGDGCSRCVYTGAREDYDAYIEYVKDSEYYADDFVNYDKDED